ncbi:hypothetical protein HOY80DRAFT_1136342 [Tuber brumale]|nr:hypothetical protein HOY80DRAFT_1136342 [Tuber brumale]
MGLRLFDAAVLDTPALDPCSSPRGILRVSRHSPFMPNRFLGLKDPYRCIIDPVWNLFLTSVIVGVILIPRDPTAG